MASFNDTKPTRSESSRPGPPIATRCIAADIGGTFTDIAYLTASGNIVTHKLLSTPRNYATAVMRGICHVLDEQAIDPSEVSQVLHGSTVATNAVLEARGAPTALITTRGFRDVLELRRVRVPRLYDPLYQKPPPLVPRRLRFEVTERIGADGSIVTPLDIHELADLAARIRRQHVEAIAVCLINSYVNPAHERRIGEALRRELPEHFISLSVDVLPRCREYERTSTTVINAYVGPPVRRYLGSLARQLEGYGIRGPLRVMQSSGGTLDADAVMDRPASVLECGPAAGVSGAVKVGQMAGYHELVTFDMGGTTAKASVIEHGRLMLADEYEIGGGMSTVSPLINGAGYALTLPVINISEVGAGGGSIVWLDKAGAIKVGPHSAGADPGPACYGRGGHSPTVTDANVLLGYINPTEIAGGAVPIDPELAHRVINRHVARPLNCDAREAAWGIHCVANANMIRCIKAVTTYRGRNPRDFSLFAFGGNGGIHATGLARTLQIGRVIVPPAAGAFSALGLLVADQQMNLSAAFAGRLDAVRVTAMEGVFQHLEGRIGAHFNGSHDRLRFQRSAELRYRGQAYELTVDLPGDRLDDGSVQTLAEQFTAEHRRRYGHAFIGNYPIEFVGLSLTGTLPCQSGGIASTEQPSGHGEFSERLVHFGNALGPCMTPVTYRETIGPEPRPGPLVIEDPGGTTVVPPDCRVRRDSIGCLVLEFINRV